MSPFRKIREATAWRGLLSKLGSLLLLFQRTPLVQMLFPEAKLLAGAGLGEATKWTVTAIVGLGAFDTVAGATEISQIIPLSGASEVPATNGEFVNFIVQVTGTPSSDKVSWSVDGLPPGLTHSALSTPSTHQISGIPTEIGQTTVTVTAWEAPDQTGSSFSREFLFIVSPPPEPDGAGPFKIGETVRIDLNSLTNPGETLKLVGKLPKGLKLNLKTREITGTVTGLEGTYPIKFNILQGKTLLRTTDFPIVISGTLFFAGRYQALLESNAALPAGAFKLLFKKGNTWSATLESPGAKARKAAGKVVLAPGTTAGTLTATFAASGSAPAVTLNATLDLESPIFSGTYNGGTVRGFRLAGNNELPPASTTLSLVFEAGVHDGITAPAGIGWANGTIGPSGTATLSGMLGDGTAVNLPIQLSATGQAIIWSQPYANTSSYFGGIVTLPDLGQAPGGLPITDKAGWFKAPDTKSLSYPAGFPAMEVTVGSSTWIVPATATALGASLGWVNNNSPAVEIDGAGLSNAAPQITTPTLPSGFTLDASFNLTAPASPSVVPWIGRVTAASGTFTGSFTLPAAFVPDGIAGPAAASGVLLQADSWGTITGCGLIKIPTAGARGNFRTAAIILRQ
jgi:hypothetical protein